MSQAPSRRRRLKKKGANLIARFSSKRDRSVLGYDQTANTSSQSSSLPVGETTLPDAIGVKPQFPLTALEARGDAATERQEPLPSNTVLGNDLRQPVLATGTGSILAYAVDDLEVNNPATSETPLPLIPTNRDGLYESTTSPVSPAFAQLDDMNPYPASTTQKPTSNLREVNTSGGSAVPGNHSLASTEPQAAELHQVLPVCFAVDPALAVAEPTPSESFWYSKRTPRWNVVVGKWKAENPKQFSELNKAMVGLESFSINRTNTLSKLQPPSKFSKEIGARVKRWQPILAAVRGIGINVAALDSHKIVPIICASIFFNIDISNFS
jgi:hypothetical protein